MIPDMPDFNPTELLRTVEAYQKSFPTLVAEARSTVKRWRMADSPMDCWRPFSTENETVCYGHVTQRKWLSWAARLKRRFLRRSLSRFWFNLARKPYSVFDHGFDRHSVLRILDTDESTSVVIHQGNLVDGVCGGGSSDRVSLVRYWLVNGVARSIFEVSEGSMTEERFVIEGARCVRSIRRYWNINDGQLDSEPNVTDYFYEQDSRGRLSKVLSEYHHDGRTYRTVEYVRPLGISKVDAAKRLEDLMVEKILTAVRDARVAGPSYALMICYCGEDISCDYPGFLVLAPEIVRQRFWAEHNQSRSQLHYYVWAPDEFRGKDDVTELSLDDFDIREAACVYFELCRLGDCRLDFDGLLQPIRKAALRLNRLNWSSITSVTDDFVVTMLDNTCEHDARSDIVACVPPEKIKVLQSRGMLSLEAPGP